VYILEYAAFLNALVKHTADWRRADWNINPVFTMSAILLKEHPYHHSVSQYIAVKLNNSFHFFVILGSHPSNYCHV
jgi:hypothetical protein